MEQMTVNGRAFDALRLLGHGKGGYSYLVKDGSGEYVLKQIHHEPCDYYNFGDKMEAELRDYERLKKIGIKIPELLDADREQERILKQYIPGETIYELVRQDKMRPEYLELVKAFCRLLYPANTNIDYFPTNFIVWNGEMYYIDYECNDYMEEWDFEHWGCKYWAKTPAFLKYVKKHK